MTQKRSTTVVAIVLALVLSPFVTISGEKLSNPGNVQGSESLNTQPGMPSSPGSLSSPALLLSNRGRRFRPSVSKPKPQNNNPIFFNPETYSSGGVYAVSIAVGDFNGDGIADLAVANQCPQSSCNSGSVSVLLGNGDGTFQAAQSFSTGGYEAYAVAVSDVNNDGNADLIVANGCQSVKQCANGTVGVLLGNGNGTF